MTRRRISLATKALAWQVAAVLAIATVVAVPRYFAVRDGLYEAIETSAGNLLQVLEDLVNEHPELLQPGALDGVIDRFTRKLPAVGRVSVVTPDRRVVADSRLAVGQLMEDTAVLALLREVDREDYVTRANEPFLRRTRLRKAIATARLAARWPTTCLSSSATICRGVISSRRASCSSVSPAR